MTSLLGSSVLEFLLVTIVIFGGCGFMMGQALAQTWRPQTHVVPYGILLAAANRFFSFALFGGELLSLTGFVIDAAVVIGIAVVAYRATRARKMVTQYPWLYEREGLFTWRDRAR
jgi:branched-chain amino acid transport system ATP-binding protein